MRDDTQPLAHGTPTGDLSFEAPQTLAERRIAGAWSTLLGDVRIGRHDDFLEIGGDPSMVMEMVELLGRAGIDTDVRTVFAHPRLSDLALAVGEITVAVTDASVDDRADGTADTAPAAIGGIPEDCIALTPDLLAPLLALDQNAIDRIIATIPGGLANIQDILPLTPLQEALLYQHQLDDTSRTWWLRDELRFADAGARDRWLAALQRVVDRTPQLRVGFRWEGLPRPVQVIHRQAMMSISAVGAPIDEPDPARAPSITAQRHAPDADGRCRVTLLQHQLVGDRRSADLLRGLASTLLETGKLPTDGAWRDYVAEAHDTPAESHTPYFQSRLGSIDEPTLPFGLATLDRAAEVRVARGSVDRATTQGIRAAACRAGATPSALLHAAWAIVLGRCSGLDDIVFGSVQTHAAPDRPDAPVGLGLRMNMLPIRLPLAEASAAGVIRLADRRLAELVTHRHASAGDAQRASSLGAAGPLFSALLNVRPAAIDPHGDGTVTVIDRHESTGYPLSLLVDDHGERLALTIQSAEPIDPARILGYVRHAIDGLVAAVEHDAATPVTRLEIIPADERQAILSCGRPADPTAARSIADRPQTLLALFKPTFARRADAPVIVQGDARLTFRALDAQANRLAHELIAQGVRRGDRVGLCVDRTPAMLVAILAILKAGAAYIPLDPAYPGDRLTAMAGDAKLALRIAETNTVGAFEWTDSATLLIDRDAATIASRPDTEPDVVHDGDDIAYVIYTSGSTGKPKGVVVPQRCVVQFLMAMAREPGMTEADKVLAVTTLSFDPSVLELLMPLHVGAQIVLASRGEAYDPAALRRLVEQSGVTIMQATPPTWRLLLDAGWQGGPHVKALIGGEALKPDLAQQLLARSGALWNIYGPTETTVWATAWRVTQPERGISVGRPVDYASLRVLDPHGQLCPTGVAGEICIGGAGVTHGYLERPDLTAAAFLADPLADPVAGQPPPRYYRTGDRGRLRADGNLEHLGRLDFQVKVRGHRIELGEIEVSLGTHPDVATSVVITVEPQPGDVRIVAFVIPRADATPEGPRLRAHLARTLPDYMLPQHFLVIDTIPLLPNGKVNRKALAATPLEVSTGRHHEPAEGATEVALAEVWREVLGIAEVGRNDNFFDLGGHSLMALKLLHRLEQRFDRKFRLVSLFEAPTIRTQAALLDHDPAGEAARCVIPIQPQGGKPPIYFVSGWGGPILLLKALAEALGDDQPLYLLDFMGLVESQGGSDSIEKIATGLVDDLRRSRPDGPFHLAGYSLGAPIVYEMARQLRAAGHDVPMLVLMDWFAPGHPHVPPFATRTWLHVVNGLRQGPIGMWPYLARYTLRLRRFFVRVAPRLYPSLQGRDAEVVDEGLESIAAPLLEASDRYRVRHYPGHVMFIACDDQSELGIGTRITDPAGGWGGFADRVTRIGNVPSTHSTLLFEAHAPRVAELLGRCMTMAQDTGPTGNPR